MKTRGLSRLAAASVRVLAVGLAVALSGASARAGESVVFHFNQNQGYNPISGLITDAVGNFYGTTTYGGSSPCACGTVFELSLGSTGTWSETVLYSFKHGASGQNPSGTLTMDKQGNLYGVAQNDVSITQVLYELVKGANGSWSETVVHPFGMNEGTPFGDLVWDSAGNLYGATLGPYTTFSGEVFELSPQPNGTWSETILFTFPAPNGVGSPEGGVIFDSRGNLYGATFFGLGGFGSNTRGGVYELSPQSSGPWSLTLLYNFTTANTSQFPNSKLTFDSAGNLYGTTQGIGLYGTAFEVSPASGGTWTEKTLHLFNSGKDGGQPFGNLVVDANGNLYGTTYDGGSGCNGSLCGVVYKLSPQAGGTWKETIVHPFESASDGSRPLGGLFMDSAGNLYGTTYNGGSRYGYGTVYKIAP